MHGNAAMLMLRPDSLSGLGCCQHSEVCGQQSSLAYQLLACCAAEQALRAASRLPCTLWPRLAVDIVSRTPAGHASVRAAEPAACAPAAQQAARLHAAQQLLPTTSTPKADLPFTEAGTVGSAYSTQASSQIICMHKASGRPPLLSRHLSAPVSHSSSMLSFRDPSHPLCLQVPADRQRCVPPGGGCFRQGAAGGGVA